MDLARSIDHTLLRPDATAAEVDRLCAEALEHRFASVCVNPHWVPRAAAHADLMVCTVIGFPLGANSTATKCFEAARAIEHGARELDMVLNIGALKSADAAHAASDIREVAAVVRKANALLKVIIETCLLTPEEKDLATRLTVDNGAHFVKTSTGFSKAGATVEDIALMRRIVGPDFGVKASGGIRSYQDAVAMIQAGASRLGTSAGIAIVQGQSGTVGAY
jgi:deoxyribose-phosphate aldolase